MRFVETAAGRPHYCAVLPHLGANHHAGYIDSGNELTAVDPHIYVSLVALDEMNRLVGNPTKEEHAAAVSGLERALARVAELEAELEQANGYLNAIDALESADFRARKKAGRPRKELAHG